MYTIEIHVLCPAIHSEVLPTDVISIELQIENIVSQALLELFEIVSVTKVIVRFIQGEYENNIPI
jgi:hypothetical protein